MTELKNRVVTDYWTLVLPSGWREGDREGKPGVTFESGDATKKVIINTLSCDLGAQQDPAVALTEFEASVRHANEKILGKTYSIIFAQRSTSGRYLASTIVGFDGQSHMGICARKYAGPDLSLIVQVHDYDSTSQGEFESLWRAVLDEFTPVEETA